jgi:hypothetical protein
MAARETSGERLRGAIERKEISVREFHRKMKAKGIPGSSYPNIHRYLSDEVDAPLEFLRAAAEVLEVRAAFLALNDGAMTEREQRAVELAADAAPLPSLGTVLAEHVPSFAHLPPLAQAAVIHTALRWAAVDHPRFDPQSSEEEAAGAELLAAVAVMDALSAPLEGWGIPFEGLGEQHRADYCMAMLHALTLAAPHEDEVPAEVHAEWTPGDHTRRDWSGSVWLKRINERLRAQRDAAKEESNAEG